MTAYNPARDTAVTRAIIWGDDGVTQIGLEVREWLTTDHPASCHGEPVLVHAFNGVFGPADSRPFGRTAAQDVARAFEPEVATDSFGHVARFLA